MLLMTSRTPAGRFKLLAFSENIAAFQALGRLNPELTSGLAQGFLNMFEMSEYLFFRYPDLSGNIFGGHRPALFQR